MIHTVELIVDRRVVIAVGSQPEWQFLRRRTVSARVMAKHIASDSKIFDLEGHCLWPHSAGSFYRYTLDMSSLKPKEGQ